MRRFLISAAILIVALPSFSQVQFGAQLGANVANLKTDLSGLSLDTKSSFLAVAGVLAEIPMVSDFYFRPELNFIQKGAKWENSSGKSVVTLNYIELPLNFAYKINAGPGNVYFGLGPNLSFGISGKEKDTDNGLGISETTKIKFDGEKNSESTDEYYHLKAFDFGANVFAGYQLNIGAFMGVGYTLGFANIYPDDGYSYKNRGFFIKLGYMFGSRNSKSTKSNQ